MKYIFVIDDPVYGGHIKSFLSQFKSLQLSENYFIFLPSYSYILKNIDTYTFINKNNIITYNPQGLNKFFFSFDLYSKLKKYLIDKKTIIHSYSQRCFFSCSLANVSSKNSKYVSSVMGGPIPFHFYNSADMHIAVSLEQIEKSKLNNKKYTLIPNRIELGKKKFHEKSYREILTTKKNVLFITRFDEDKIIPIQNAVMPLKILSKNYNIIVLGTGTEKEKCERLFLEHIDKDKIVFLGFHNNPIDLIDSTAIVVGMGRSILEFMLKGIPSIVIGFNSTNELFKLKDVEIAFKYNFSGRNTKYKELELLNTLDFEEKKIYDFLYDNYAIELFNKKYTSMLKKLKKSKSNILNILFEYIHFNLFRIKNKFKR